ncbi:MAG TPA: hypothetical protein VFD58_04710 [Blastocatellia bacterium]|nr:hypothetical protein [Blastocatellia bacterium]
MRTLFEDTDENADRADDGSARGLPVITWLIALIMVGSAAGAYFWVQHLKQQKPAAAAVAVSLDDDNQVKQAISQFCQFVVNKKWDEAQKMLSGEAVARLEKEKKNLHDSLFAERFAQKKDDKLVQAFPINVAAHTTSTARSDCAFIFEDRAQEIIAITVVRENDRLVINSW